MFARSDLFPSFVKEALGPTFLLFFSLGAKLGKIVF